MLRRVCPKCLNTSYVDGKHCEECGTELLEWGLLCECGAPIHPYFPLRVFPPWGRSTAHAVKHCGSCGRDNSGIVKKHIELIRRAWKA